MSELRYYFASDGNFGAWEEGSFLADSSVFTPSDWRAIDDATDMQRAKVALNIYTERLMQVGNKETGEKND